MTKMSILMLYLRIFIQRWFRIICYILLCIIASYMIAAFFASIFQCIPVARAWNKTIPGSCIDITANWYANAGFSIATDIIILALPMYPIYNSKIVLGRKIALMCVFALGALWVRIIIKCLEIKLINGIQCCCHQYHSHANTRLFVQEPGHYLWVPLPH